MTCPAPTEFDFVPYLVWYFILAAVYWLKVVPEKYRYTKHGLLVGFLGWIFPAFAFGITLGHRGTWSDEEMRDIDDDQ